ncbi:MAG TPA: endonuclease [Streptosporangiaceae bacterium]
MTGTEHRAVLAALLDRYGQTYAEQAGIKLADRPSPLYQMLVAATLASAPVTAETAAAAARELWAAGLRTPRAMRDAGWQDRVDALGRGHYRRYDERTATELGDQASLLCQRWRGDLRRLRDEAGGDGDRIESLLTGLPGIGPAGASIFRREVQVVWPEAGPFVDLKVLEGAARVGLPRQPGALAELAGSPPQLTRLAAALVRVARDATAARKVREAALAAR